jgi:hypothetical protein
VISDIYNWAKAKVSAFVAGVVWVGIALNSKYGWWALALYVLVLAAIASLAVWLLVAVLRPKLERRAWRARQKSMIGGRILDELDQADVPRALVVAGDGWTEVLVPRKYRGQAAPAVAAAVPKGHRYRVMDLPWYRCRAVRLSVEASRN